MSTPRGIPGQIGRSQPQAHVVGSAVSVIPGQYIRDLLAVAEYSPLTRAPLSYPVARVKRVP